VWSPCASVCCPSSLRQVTFDRTDLGARWVGAGVAPSKQAAHFLWAPGPTVHSLDSVLASGHLPRYDLYVPCTLHPAALAL
jgi:hypothetical protein